MSWINVEDRLPKKPKILKVKTLAQNEIKACFYPDKANWIIKYGFKPSYWWDFKTHEAIYNVIEWWEDEEQS